jgi:hypothetical protein
MKTPAMIHYRQGDVLIERIAEIPKAAVKQMPSEKIILAHGEVTGHCHLLKTKLPAEWFQLDETLPAGRQAAALAGKLFVSLPAAGVVEHPEHAALNLPPGRYRVTRQREYSPGAIRDVAD